MSIVCLALENDFRKKQIRTVTDTHRPTLLSSPSCHDVLEAVKQSDVTFIVNLRDRLHLLMRLN